MAGMTRTAPMAPRRTDTFRTEAHCLFDKERNGGESIEQNQNNQHRTNQIRYTQNWRSYGGAAAHMLRFFFKLPNATIAEMSAPTLAAWTACYRAISRLTDRERAVAETYFSETWDDRKVSVQTVASRHGITETEAWEIVHKVTRDVAIERGLADR